LGFSNREKNRTMGILQVPPWGLASGRKASILFGDSLGTRSL
jgi:hypothetical protein